MTNEQRDTVQALVEFAESVHAGEWDASMTDDERWSLVIRGRALLAQPQEAQDPVGRLIRGDGGEFRYSFGDHLRAVYAMPEGEHDLYAAPAQRAQPPADGWVCVPATPTEAMLSAMAECDGYLPGDRDRPGLVRWEDYWRMALSAAPQPPAREPMTEDAKQDLLRYAVERGHGGKA